MNWKDKQFEEGSANRKQKVKKGTKLEEGYEKKGGKNVRILQRPRRGARRMPPRPVEGVPRFGVTRNSGGMAGQGILFLSPTS